MQQPTNFGYSPYGHRLGSLNLLGFNGERLDSRLGSYFLGNGYRLFSPVLMRFNVADSMSPFGGGGLNSYAYCSGDPIKFRDPSGHFSVGSFLSEIYARVINKFGFGARSNRGMPRFETVPVNYIDRNVHLKRTSSMQSVMPRPSSGEIIDTWDKFALHGSTDGHGPSLRSGLNPNFQNSSWAQRFGEGFYASPDVMRPWEYARDLANKNGQKPQVFGVYTKNFDRLKPGRDYEFRVRDTFPAERVFGELVIRKRAYHLVAIESIRSGRVMLPRSKEAPF
nr:RHS repeat-associated core domain-containing protein [uncultured Pseudomonas sp.]